MNQIHIDIVELQTRQRASKHCFNVRRTITSFRQFSDDKQILALHTARVQPTAKHASDGRLVHVDGGTIDVAVASFEGLFEGVFDLLVGGLVAGWKKIFDCCNIFVLSLFFQETSIIYKLCNVFCVKQKSRNLSLNPERNLRFIKFMLDSNYFGFYLFLFK